MSEVRDIGDGKTRFQFGEGGQVVAFSLVEFLLWDSAYQLPQGADAYQKLRDVAAWVLQTTGLELSLDEADAFLFEAYREARNVAKKREALFC